jgi:GT2 family glycosyltransferase
MLLSIIIVNYNVKHFLEQCLYSVQKALKGMQAEITVVDNNSADSSMEYLVPKFPNVRFIANKENGGFAKASNQGLAVSSGRYILFLNPDTIVAEDCFQKCISFLETNPEAGALGVKMLDGSGKFLKESKRAFPSPLTSLYKLFGLSRLFPKSKIFSRYHLGHLDEDETNEVDVLAGAFMMVKREVINKTGSFDEAFFMYGEDVDLSYRVQKAGYKVFYFAGTSIIHFKGESTRKSSMNYVRMFYNAMSIFVRKHYKGSRAGIFIFLIHVAIWIRAFFSAIGHFIRRIGLPVIDAGLIFLSFLVIKWVWAGWVRPETDYDQRLVWIAFPAYTVLYLLVAYYAGLYDRWYKRTELIRSTSLATIILLAAYALLPEYIRFSRGILLFGSLLAFALISLLRWILVRTKVISSNKERKEIASTMIASSPEEFPRVQQLIKEAGLQEKILGRLAVDDRDTTTAGSYKHIEKLSATLPFTEVVFCEGRLSYSAIIQAVQHWPAGIRLKFHAAGSSSIVGSDSKDSSGEAVSKENGYKLANPYNLRIKRLIDVAVAVTGLLTFPVHLFLIKKPVSFFSNCFSVLFAQKTWISYAIQEKNLPFLRKGVLACNGAAYADLHQLPGESLAMIDYWYARNYEPATDLRTIWKMYRRLGG